MTAKRGSDGLVTVSFNRRRNEYSAIRPSEELDAKAENEYVQVTLIDEEGTYLEDLSVKSSSHTFATDTIGMKVRVMVRGTNETSSAYSLQSAVVDLAA